MSPATETVVDGVEGKRSYVRAMFTAIAPRYDLLNHVLSLNIDRRWRRHAVRALEWPRRPEGRYLDVCAGTLDLAALLMRQRGFHGTVVGADFVVPMLQLGKGKEPGVRPVGADALELPFPGQSFDGAMVAFGVRNLADVGAGLREMARVLRPGGRLVILEFGTPSVWPFSQLYRLYFRHVLPLVGRLVSRHEHAYSYLPSSVESFPTPEAFTALMVEAGFDLVSSRSLTMGIAHVYRGDRR